MHGEPVPKKEPRGSSCGTVCMQLAKHSHARGRADSLTKTLSPTEMRFQGHVSYKQKVSGEGAGALMTWAPASIQNCIHSISNRARPSSDINTSTDTTCSISFSFKDRILFKQTQLCVIRHPKHHQACVGSGSGSDFQTTKERCRMRNSHMCRASQVMQYAIDLPTSTCLQNHRHSLCSQTHLHSGALSAHLVHCRHTCIALFACTHTTPTPDPA